MAPLRSRLYGVEPHQPLASMSSFITGRCGARFEAELFAAILDCPFVIRSFEFAPADGALFATINVDPPTRTCSERFWELNKEGRRTRYTDRKLDAGVKSTASFRVEDQIYITPIRQQERVAFYVGVCASQPACVDLILNNRTAQASTVSNDARYVAVNVSRKSFLPPPAYCFLSPCNSPIGCQSICFPKYLCAFKSVPKIMHLAQLPGQMSNSWTGDRAQSKATTA
jgi:hypothetical protein